MVRFAQRKNGLVLDSIDVTLLFQDAVGALSEYILNCTPQEAFTITSMPCFCEHVVSLVPNYKAPEDESFNLDDFREALSEMPKE